MRGGQCFRSSAGIRSGPSAFQSRHPLECSRHLVHGWFESYQPSHVLPGLCICIPYSSIKLLFCSFYTSTSSTTNVRADSAILDTSYKLWGHKTTAQAEILQYHYHTSIRRVDNAIPCHRTYCIRPARHAQPMRRRKIERNEEKRNGRKKQKKGRDAPQ